MAMGQGGLFREKILSTAARLFFEQGFLQTGVNQLIEESGVARQTFYRHFPSKEELGSAYLDARASEWLAALRMATARRRTARGIVRGLFEYLERLAEETRFRGCGMMNMAAEFADVGAAMRETIREHKTAQRDLIRLLLQPCGVASSIADQINILLEGALAGAAGLLDTQPIRDATRAANQLLSSCLGER
jgi:AcrR family transcriptional regulator